MLALGLLAAYVVSLVRGQSGVAAPAGYWLVAFSGLRRPHYYWPPAPPTPRQCARRRTPVLIAVGSAGSITDPRMPAPVPYRY